MCPTAQWPERTKLMYEAAEKAGWQHRFRPLDLAVRFDNDWRYGEPDSHDHARSKNEQNLHGIEQGTCVHLGLCDVGCPVKARNTLDFNYLAVAKQKGARVLPLHLVRDIRASAGDYEVIADEIAGGALHPKTFTAPRVIVAAGSIGSTELLLRARASGGLANLSARLGVGWSSNGDFLTPAIHPFREVKPTRGPTITCAIDLLDREYMNQAIFVEDGGLPDLAARCAATIRGRIRPVTICCSARPRRCCRCCAPSTWSATSCRGSRRRATPPTAPARSRTGGSGSTGRSRRQRRRSTPWPRCIASSRC